MAEEGNTIDTEQAVLLLKQRLNRMTGISAMDDYLEARINAAVKRLEDDGITVTDSVRDMMLVVDLAAWQYANRDKPGGEPEWLRDEKRSRWLQDRQVKANDP